MTSRFLFSGKRFRISSWEATPGFVSAASAALEYQVRQLIHVEMNKIKSLDDCEKTFCDMLIISAEGLDDEFFPDWIKKIAPRIPKIHGIPVPSLIFADISPAVQREQLIWAVEGNWYFDIIEPIHATSLPIRMANLLRIFDHLHEVRRMTEATFALSEKVKVMEEQMNEMLKSKSEQ